MSSTEGRPQVSRQIREETTMHTFELLSESLEGMKRLIRNTVVDVTTGPTVSLERSPCTILSMMKIPLSQKINLSGESQGMRNRILKANLGIASERDSTLFQRIADSGQNYLEKLDNLKKFKAKSRSITKSTSLHSDWTTEQIQLRRSAFELENELAGMLEVLQLHSSIAMGYAVAGSLHSPSESKCDSSGKVISSVTSLVHDNAVFSLALQQHKRSCGVQIQDLKVMLRQLVKSEKKSKLEELSGYDYKPSTSAVAAVFADILLGTRTDLIESWGPMNEEEKELSISVSNDQRKIFMMLNEERLSMQTEELRKDICSLGEIPAEEEDGEVEMLKEEWLLKLALLDDSHAKALRQFTMDRLAIKKGTNMSLMSYLLSTSDSGANSEESLRPRRRSCFPVDGVGGANVSGNKRGFDNKAVDANCQESNNLRHSNEVDDVFDNKTEGNCLSLSCQVDSVLFPVASEETIFQHSAEINLDYIKGDMNIMMEEIMEGNIDSFSQSGSPPCDCDRVDGDINDGSQLSDVEAFGKKALHLTDDFIEAADTEENQECKWQGVKQVQDRNGTATDDVRDEEGVNNDTEDTKTVTAIETNSDSSGLICASIDLQGISSDVIDPACNDSVITPPQAQGIIDGILTSECKIKSIIGLGCETNTPSSSTDIGGLETATCPLDIDCGGSSNSVWNETDQTTFVKTFRRFLVSGMQRRSFLLVLKAQLPHKAEGDILNYEDRYRKLRALVTRQALCVKTYETAREDLINQAREGISAIRTIAAQNLKNDKETLDFESRRAVQHSKLIALRKSREEKNLILSEAQKVLEIAEKQRHDEIQTKDIAAKRASKGRVLEYKVQKDNASDSRRRCSEEEKVRKNVELKEEIEKNKIRVQSRRDLIDDKDMKRRLKEEEVEAADNKRLKILIQLSEQVPYWESVQQAKANLFHITASARGHEYQQGELRGRGHMPLNGFTDGQVISDARFRLASALRQAGVQQSDAARSAVAALHPRPHLAIHGLL